MNIKFNFFKRLLTVFWLIIATVILLELASTAALRLKVFYHSGPNSYLPIKSEVYDELRAVNELIFYPSRWYTSAPNYKGRYVQTDMYGFRINPESISKNCAIGFWGGSTMFSITTSQNHTIPGNIDLAGCDSLNFGQGGYSTNAELMAFIEGVRAYPNIKAAFFYDGVNEVARYLEWAQKPKVNNFLYQKIGSYYEGGIQNALKNSQPFYEFNYKSNFLYLIDRVFIANRIKTTNQFDVATMSKEVANIYYQNITDIQILAKSKGIIPIFSWQPSIFTSQKKLTPRELTIADDRTLVKQLYIETTRQILSDKRRKLFHFLDLTAALDELEGDIFSDWHHINEEGNKEIALRISSYLNEFHRP